MDSFVKRAIDVRFSDVSGKKIVVRRNDAFELNDTAFEIWKRCDGKNTVSDIGRMLAELYDAPIEVVTADCAALIKEMLERGFLKEIDNS